MQNFLKGELFPKMYKKSLYLIALIFLITSCGETVDSVKRGLTGEKKLSTDEFLVKKKMPLILPPDYENLPLPSEAQEEEETFSLKKKNVNQSSDELTSSKSSSNEESILKKIKQK